MSKGLGQKIAIKFTEELIGDVTGYVPTPLGGYEEIKVNTGIISASSQYTTYDPKNSFDGSTSSQWYTRTALPQWIQIEIIEPIAIAKFRWYIGSSYRPNGFDFQGSNDGITWDVIYSGNSDNTTGWKEFTFANYSEYKFYRWNITSRYSSYLYIYEIEMYYNRPIGQERAFSISGQQRAHIGGALIAGNYQVKKVEPHQTEENTLLLTMKPLSRFNNVEGSLSVSYDASKGSLTGRGGPVESFEEAFTPEDLIPEPNPWIRENISAIVDGSVELIHITKPSAYNKEYIAVAADGLVELIHKDIINP